MLSEKHPGNCPSSQTAEAQSNMALTFLFVLTCKVLINLFPSTSAHTAYPFPERPSGKCWSEVILILPLQWATCHKLYSSHSERRVPASKDLNFWMQSLFCCQCEAGPGQVSLGAWPCSSWIWQVFSDKRETTPLWDENELEMFKRYPWNPTHLHTRLFYNLLCSSALRNGETKAPGPETTHWMTATSGSHPLYLALLQARISSLNFGTGISRPGGSSQPQSGQLNRWQLLLTHATSGERWGPHCCMLRLPGTELLSANLWLLQPLSAPRQMQGDSSGCSWPARDIHIRKQATLRARSLSYKGCPSTKQSEITAQITLRSLTKIWEGVGNKESCWVAVSLCGTLLCTTETVFLGEVKHHHGMK